MLGSTVRTNHCSNNIIDIKFNKKKCKKKEREEYRGPRLLQNACIHYRYNISFPPFLSNLGDLCFSVCPPASCTARIVQHCSLRTTYLPACLPSFLLACLSAARAARMRTPIRPRYLSLPSSRLLGSLWKRLWLATVCTGTLLCCTARNEGQFVLSILFFSLFL